MGGPIHRARSVVPNGARTTYACSPAPDPGLVGERQRPEVRLSRVLLAQDGVVSWPQARAAGCQHSVLRGHVARGSWRRLHPGVYLAQAGPPSYRQRVRAALLAVGGEVLASHETALWLAGLQEREPDRVHVAVEDGRHVRRPQGVQVHTLPRLGTLAHPAADPPRVQLERATVDVAHRCRGARQALDVVYAVLQQRLSTPDRLRAALEQRPRHRHRAALEAVLIEAAAGALSGLERAHLGICRRHGLPPGSRQRKAAGSVGNRWLDVLHDEDGMTDPVVTELDGRTGHDRPQDRLRDMARDNLDEDLGRGHLRYGTQDVFGSGCEVAAQTARALLRRGWRGQPRPCGPGCTLTLAVPRRPAA